LCIDEASPFPPKENNMTTGLELRSKITADNTLELSLAEVEVPTPGPQEVVVRIEAAPLNPSDLASLFGPADLSTARAAGTAMRPVITADIPEPGMKLVATRVGRSITTGAEGAGVVIDAGESDAAQALLGKTVSLAVGGMHTRYRCVKFFQCMRMPDSVTPRQAASSFINPMTALCMLETMRREGHTALVHTAAASNLGQMLNRICIADGIDLINIVRKPEQEDMLRELGEGHVVNSSENAFTADLTAALIETGATIAFDAVGGGKLASQILGCMEAAGARDMKHYDHYGSDVHKQVYVYGGLDLSPTILSRNFGFAWSIGGWLLPNVMQKIDGEAVKRMQSRVASELDTTFASNYTRDVSLSEALTLEAIAVYSKQATGEKYLITPHK
jgi:NADPH2:quinone reductase